MDTKDPAAVALAKKRWEGTTAEERSAVARDLAAASAKVRRKKARLRRRAQARAIAEVA